MPRVGNALARDADQSRAHHGGVGDHNQLWQVHAEHRWKIIRLSTAESRRPGIDRGRRRRKSGGRSLAGEGAKDRVISTFSGFALPIGVSVVLSRRSSTLHSFCEKKSRKRQELDRNGK